MVIPDRTTLGGVAGLVGTIPQLILNFISVQIGFGEFYAFQVSASIFVVERMTLTPMGLIIGGFTWILTAAFFGAILARLIDLEGEDFWWIKGLLFGSVLFIVLFGILFNLGAGRIVPLDPQSKVSALAENALYGIVTAYFIVRWGRTFLHEPSK
ncbi:MAG: hypothetical protein HYY09_00025 [Firmicutes bacterium]|nr:hypothetical protein [Bacillota bacterium]